MTKVTVFVVEFVPPAATTVSITGRSAAPKLPHGSARLCCDTPVNVAVPVVVWNVQVYAVMPGFGVETLASNVHRSWFIA